MFGAAKGRLSSLKWRTLMGVIFAIGAGLVLDSAAIALGWFALLCTAMGADYYIGKRYLAATTAKARETLGLLFIIGCAVTIVVFTALAVYLAWYGGPSGRLLTVFMAASSLVSVMLFLFQNPVFMLITAAPVTACLVMVPFAHSQIAPAGPLQTAFGVAFGLGAFLAYAMRSAINSGRMFRGLEAANKAAMDRQTDAEIKRAEAEEANRTKSEFLTTMTHELRTPLNAVIGYSEIIAEDMEIEGRDDLASDAKRINSAARHLLGLIDQILQLSTVDQDRSALHLSDVDVKRLIEGAAASIQEQATANNNRVAVRVAQDVTFAHSDQEKLGVCVAQLLSNAAKFTSNGLVAISADRERGHDREWLRIAVSDTGIGMTTEEVARAFQPFTQIDASKTRTAGGMGLGLSITLKTAQALGGEVVAVSEPGAGSTFTLRVPLRLGLTEVANVAAFTPETGVEVAA
jgi:signal transduction histidine kinase